MTSQLEPTRNHDQAMASAGILTLAMASGTYDINVLILESESPL